MKRAILRALLLVTAASYAVFATGTHALFTDTVYSENNTFTSGTLAIKMFYDCRGTNNEVTYTPAPGEVGAIVECPIVAPDDGSRERDALRYNVNDGATWSGFPNFDIYNLEPLPTRWTTANHWFDSLSSPFDWTNMAPGDASYPPKGGNGDFLSLGNAGTIPANFTMRVSYEAAGVNEALAACA